MEQMQEPLSIESFEQNRKKCLSHAGLTYSAAAVLPVILSLFVAIMVPIFGDASFFSSGDYPNWYLYLTYLLPQLSFLGAAAFYFLRSKEPVKAVVPRCKWHYFLIAVLLQFGLLFSLSELNGYFIRLLELMGYHASGLGIPSLDGWNLLPAVLVIALLPAVMEEVIFRGIISRNMHASGWGLLPTILISGAMFSLFHGNPEQTVYQFCCGMCFTLIAIRSGSILPTVIAHFLNNAVILIFAAVGFADFSELGAAYIALTVISAICLVGTLVYLIFFDTNNAQRGGVKWGKAFFLAAAVGFIVCGVEWIYALIAGFYA